MNEQALKDRIHAIAKIKDIPFNECWKQLLLERFLARISRSQYAEIFIFKGGMLLSYMLEIGRETTDIDFLLTKMNATQEDVSIAVKEIASFSIKDGFSFLYEKIELLEQPHMNYPGYRVTLNALYGHMKDTIKVDVGIGDIVTPEQRPFQFFEYRGNPLFENEISLLAYPVETIFSEKLETVLSKGAINSRMKDYHDLILLTRRAELMEQKNLQRSISETFQNRNTPFELIHFSEDELKPLQKLWTAHLLELADKKNDLGLPDHIQAVIHAINSFLIQMQMISLGKMVAELKGKKLLEQVKVAISEGANVNDKSRNGHRPLQMALTKELSELGRLLIEAGADISNPDNSGLTPLQTAINHGDFKNANLIIGKGAAFSFNTPQGYIYSQLYQFQHFGRNDVWPKKNKFKWPNGPLAPHSR